MEINKINTSVLIISLLALFLFANVAVGQKLILKSDAYSLNGHDSVGTSALIFNDWGYLTVKLGDRIVNEPYTKIKTTKMGKEFFWEILMPESDLIDSIAVDNYKIGYIKFKQGDVYMIPRLTKLSRREVKNFNLND